MPSIKKNLFWGKSYNWPRDGNEWDDQAKYSKKSYDDWINSIFENFISLYIDKNKTVLEIAPGHGRWTDFLLRKSKKLILVDLNKECIEYCKTRFKKYKSIKYFVNDGKSLSFIKDQSVDFVWSYDSFVHMEKDVTEFYIKELSRVLSNGGIAVIHHPDRKNYFLWLRFLKNLGPPGKKIYNIFTINRNDKLGGWRSDVSKELIKKLSTKYNLQVVSQQNEWGKNHEFNIKLFRDIITIIRKN